MRRSQSGRDLLPQLIPALTFALVVSMVGEAVGYTVGHGRTGHLDAGELHRTRYVRKADRLRDEDESTWPGSETPAAAGTTAAG